MLFLPLSLCYSPALIKELWQHYTEPSFCSSISSPGLSPPSLWLPALGLCLASLEVRQRWSLISTCKILSRQALCVSEWKTLTMYDLAVSGCSSLSEQNWLNAHTKNLNRPPLSPVGHMWTFPTVSLESLCLAPLCCDQCVLRANCWNGFCMSLDQTFQFFDQ